jgi:hypothetical protein
MFYVPERQCMHLTVQFAVDFGSPNGTRLSALCHFTGPKNSPFPGPNPLPLAHVMYLPASKTLRTGPYKS